MWSISIEEQFYIFGLYQSGFKIHNCYFYCDYCVPLLLGYCLLKDNLSLNFHTISCLRYLGIRTIVAVLFYQGVTFISQFQNVIQTSNYISLFTYSNIFIISPILSEINWFIDF